MMRTHRLCFPTSIRLISVLLCCSLLHISLESLLAARRPGRSLSLQGAVQNETIPGKGEPGVSANPGFDFFAIPVPQAGNSKLVFSSNRDGNAEIYSMNVDGTSLSRLTDNAYNDDHPRWSPDGTKILFQSDRDNPETGNADVYVMNADGSSPTRLTTDNADDSAAVWSPDGSKIMFQSLRNGQYYQIYAMNADGTNQQNVSNGIAADYQPSWSHDGSGIAFASERDHPGTPSIYVMSVDGLNQTRLTFSSEPIRDEHPTWSPDGNRIAFVSTRDSTLATWQETDDEGGILDRSSLRINKEVYVMNAVGTNQIRLTNTLENDDSPEWSREGAQIVFRSDRERECCDPSDQVWTMNADGSNQVNLSNNTFGDYAPSWSGIISNAPQYLGDTNYGTTEPASTVTGDSTSLPVRITFDELPNNTVVADQYHNQYGVKFYSSNFFYPVHTYQNCGFCSTTSPPNYINTKPNDYGQVTIEFTQPASNIKFYFVGLDTLSGPFGRADIYVNGSFSSTITLSGVFNSTGEFSLPSTTNVTKIIIYGLTDPAGVGIDDLTFTISADVKITNARVNGHLNGTTQQALAGADIALNATALPSGFAGGTYAWTFTGPYVPVGGTNSSSVTIRSTNTGTGTANISYTKNGLTTSATVTINAVLPTLTSFTASQNVDRITPPFNCEGGLTLFTSYILGCPQFSRNDPAHLPGIRFTTNAQVPAGQFLNDPSQTGIKYVQLVSAFQKSLVYGSVVCTTARTEANQSDTGWQLDTTDPYNTGGLSDPPQRFSGQSVTMIAEDAPRSLLQLTPDIYSEMDAMFVDDPFEMYVVYFVGNNPSNPTFQRVLGFQNNSVAYIPWRWGGLIMFNPTVTNSFSLQSTTQAGSIQAQSKSQMRPYSGNVANIAALLQQCPSGPPRATRMIDVSKFFVRQHYLDFLNREPDQAGWDFWRHGITQCGFDTNCIRGRRFNVSRAFFESIEFISNKPALQPSNKGTDSYNREFVRQCYYGYLRRTSDPEVFDPEGFSFWVNSLNNAYQARGDGAYFEIIEAFIFSGEYRDRFPSLPNF